MRDCRLYTAGVKGSVERSVGGVKYVSKVKVEPVEGKVRRAYLPVMDDPVYFGVHSEVAEHYGVSIERVLEVYADGCPVARSVEGSIEISSELKLT